jgi:hypothetical protein
MELMTSKPSRKRRLPLLVAGTAAAALALCASAFVRAPTGGAWFGVRLVRINDHLVQPLHSFGGSSGGSSKSSSSNEEKEDEDEAQPIAAATNMRGSSSQGGGWRKTEYPMEPMLQIRPNLVASDSVGANSQSFSIDQSVEYRCRSARILVRSLVKLVIS